MADLVELYRRWDAGESLSTMSNRLGMDRKTVRKYVAAAIGAGLSPGTGLGVDAWAQRIGEWFPDRADTRLRRLSWTVFDEHEAWIREQLKAQVTMATIWQRLRDDKGVAEGSERSLNRWVTATIDPAERAGAQATGLMPPSPPGEVGQIDYGLMGTWEAPGTGKRSRVQAWIMTLPCSRQMFVWPTFRMRQLDWEQAHVAAFEFLGGVPRRLVCDNLKTGVVKPDLYDPAINRSYQQMAGHYGCLIDPARPVKPKDKPSVERAVQYVRGSWWRGRDFTSLEAMRADAVRWCRQVAGARQVRAMPGGTVADVFERVERPALLPLPARAFEVAEQATGKVAPDCHVSVKGALYSVPYRLIGQRLDIRLTGLVVEFYYRGQLVKTHPLATQEQWRHTDPSDYPPAQAAWYHKDAVHVRADAARIGPACLALVERRMAGNALAAFRSVAGIVRLATKHDPALVEAACRIALGVGDVSYHTVKNLVAQGAPEPPQRPQGDNGAPGLLRGPAAFTTS